MLKLNVLGWIALVLVVVGGLNWALVGIFSFDLVAAIFGEMSALARVVYVVVGVAAVYMLILAASTCKGSAAESAPK
jgi:uncharacterized membrane protein YuzA (DUF378 family)